MSVISKIRLLSKLQHKRYRESYVSAHVRNSISYQVRRLRERHRLTQRQLADKIGTTQTAISRIENPDSGRASIRTLLKLTSVYDVGLIIKFVPFSRFLDEFKDLSPSALLARSFDNETGRAVEKATPSAASSTQAMPITVGGGSSLSFVRSDVVSQFTFPAFLGRDWRTSATVLHGTASDEIRNPTRELSTAGSTDFQPYAATAGS